ASVGHPERVSCPTRRSSDLPPAKVVHKTVAWKSRSSVPASNCGAAITGSFHDYNKGSACGALIHFTPIASGPERERQQHERHRRSEEHTSELQSRENLVCRL